MTGILGRLTYFGKYFADRESDDEKVDHTKFVRRTPINADNVYNSWNVIRTRRLIKDIANKRYKLSRDPLRTGIIPNFYNAVRFVEKNKQDAIERGKLKKLRARLGDYPLLKEDYLYDDELSINTTLFDKHSLLDNFLLDELRERLRQAKVDTSKHLLGLNKNIVYFLVTFTVLILIILIWNKSLKIN